MEIDRARVENVLHTSFSKMARTGFHAERGAFDDDGVAVMEEALEDGGGDGGVAVEDGWPLVVRRMEPRWSMGR